MTLIPVIGGVVLASSSSSLSSSLSFPGRGGGQGLWTLIRATLWENGSSSSGGVLSHSLSWNAPTAGVAFACLSNICFCSRSFLVQRLKQQFQQQPQQQQQNHRPSRNHDDPLKMFFHVTFVASVLILPVIVWMIEGHSIVHYYYYYKAGSGGFEEEENQRRRRMAFASNVVKSSIWFGLYQIIQLQVMNTLRPLEFSILTPVVKAFMIAACSLTFGDTLGVVQLVGIGITTSGGYYFSTQSKTQSSNNNNNNHHHHSPRRTMRRNPRHVDTSTTMHRQNQRRLLQWNTKHSDIV